MLSKLTRSKTKTTNKIKMSTKNANTKTLLKVLALIKNKKTIKICKYIILNN